MSRQRREQRLRHFIPRCRWGDCRETSELSIVCMDMGTYRQPMLVCAPCAKSNDRTQEPRAVGQYRLFIDYGRGGRSVYA